MTCLAWYDMFGMVGEDDENHRPWLSLHQPWCFVPALRSLGYCIAYLLSAEPMYPYCTGLDVGEYDGDEPPVAAFLGLGLPLPSFCL